MADFDYCIDIAVETGKLSKNLAKQLKSAPDKELALNQIAADLTRTKREAAIQAVRIAKAWDNISAYEGNKVDALNALLTKDYKGKAKYANVEYRQNYYKAKYHAMAADLLHRFRTRRLGFSQDSAGLDKLIRAIYGESVDDAEIMAYAKGWHDLAETVRKDFNALGGSIAKNENWLLPQNHDLKSVAKLGRDGWKELVRPLLDRTKITDDLGRPLSDKEFDEALDYVFETITTGGLNKAKDLTLPRLGKKLSRRGSEQRFLYFKDAESWMKYQKSAGRGDIFTTLTGWVNMKADDIGLMEILGPNPDSTYRALAAQVEKSQGMSGNNKRQSEAIFKIVSGKTNQGELTGLADFMQSTRNVLTASTLGKAFLSSISDVGAVTITSSYNNIAPLKVLSRQMKLMSAGSEEARIFGNKIGIITENGLSRAHGANRYADVYGTGITAKLSEGVMRASLLAPWTDSGRKAFGMEFSAMLAENFGKSFDELDSHLKRAFNTYGISEADWNIFRASEALDFDGVKFANSLENGGEKFHRMILSETDYAVPTPDARVRAITTGGMNRASIEGQVWRSAMMLKSFPITMITTHLYRAAYQATIGEKLAYLGALTAYTTILGGLAIQAKDLAAGRKARPVNSMKFFVAAFVQGGGAGIFGDFLFSDVNRFGSGFVETMAGPTGELIDTSLKFTLGNVRQAIKGEETNVLGEGVQILNRYTPDIWQTQVFSDAVFGQLELLANPDTQRRFNRIVRNRRDEYDQEYWWRPGETLPEAVQ